MKFGDGLGHFELTLYGADSFICLPWTQAIDPPMLILTSEPELE